MKSLIVYRLENEKGVGPFRGGHRDEAESLLGHTNPLYWDDKLSRRRKNTMHNEGWVYAWSCSDTFNLWMNGKEDFMADYGYRKVAYKTNQYRSYKDQELWKYIGEDEDWVQVPVSGMQVIFNPKRSIKVT